MNCDKCIFLSCRSCADQLQIPFSGNSKSSFVTVPWVPEGFFFLLLAAKIERRNFRCQRIVLETCFRNGCSFAVMDLSYTLYLCASVFIIILPLNFRPCPRGLAWPWSFEEELRSIISVCHPPERPFPSPDRPILFFLGKLRIHCLISPIFFFIAEKRDLCDFLTCDKRE